MRTRRRPASCARARRRGRLGKTVALLLTATTGASAKTSDEGPPPLTFLLAASSGYSLPIGSPDSGAPDAVNNVLKGLIPIDFEAGVQVGSHWRILAYGGVGVLVRVSSSCRTIECGGSSAHVGAKVGYAGRGPGGWDLIVALGAGWHRLSLSTTTPDTSTEASTSGAEGILELAALYPIAPAFWLGPFVSTSIVSSSGWTNVIDGQTTQSAGNHVDGAFNFGFKLELRL
jgi:hypothetical protein